MAVWRSREECSAAIERYLGDNEKRMEIAANGQKQTLAKHTFRGRVEEILRFIQ
ncbi:glycosyltransferase family protein [Bradyrhizobium ottawaense]|uniref:glycosyltransferase family protein n=1 Tax=Bradyrhizobium ottawaense TaxID=931866 RepID=UPI0035186D50